MYGEDKRDERRKQLVSTRPLSPKESFDFGGLRRGCLRMDRQERREVGREVILILGAGAPGRDHRPWVAANSGPMMHQPTRGASTGRGRGNLEMTWVRVPRS